MLIKIKNKIIYSIFIIKQTNKFLKDNYIINYSIFTLPITKYIYIKDFIQIDSVYNRHEIYLHEIILLI